MSKAKDSCLGCLIMIGLMIGGFVMFMNWLSTPLTPEQQAAKAAVAAEAEAKREAEEKAKKAKRAITHSPEKQSARDKIIQELLDKGVFSRIEPRGNSVDLYVQPAFYLLSIQDKGTFVSLVFARYLDEDNWLHSISIKDGLSGKEVGDYFASRGINMH